MKPLRGILFIEKRVAPVFTEWGERSVMKRVRTMPQSTFEGGSVGGESPATGGHPFILSLKNKKPNRRNFSDR